MSDEERVKELITIDPEEVDYARRVAAEHGVELKEADLVGILPVPGVVWILLGTATAVSAVIYQMNVYRGGQVIDLRTDAPKVFYRTKDLDYGLVAILKNDGQVAIEVKEPRGMFGQVIDLLKEKLPDLSKEGVAEIVKMIKEILGDNVNVKSTPVTA